MHTNTQTHLYNTSIPWQSAMTQNLTTPCCTVALNLNAQFLGKTTVAEQTVVRFYLCDLYVFECPALCVGCRLRFVGLSQQTNSEIKRQRIPFIHD